MRGLQQEIENRMLIIRKNKEHFKNFERNLHRKIIKSKIRQIANDVESRSSIINQNASHYNVFESKLEKNLKRKVNKILTKRKLSSGRISNRKEDLADNIKEISDLLKINDKEFRRLERKITQILLRRGLDGVLDVNFKEINKPVCKSCFSNSDEEDRREREKILEINRKVFDKFEKDMSNIVILEKNTKIDENDKLVSEKFSKYRVNTSKLSNNVLAKHYKSEIESDFSQPPLKRILSTRDKDDIRERANIIEANAKAFELFEKCLKNTTTTKPNCNMQPFRNLTSKSGDESSGKNKDGLFNEEKNFDDFNDDLESTKVIKTLKELLEKSSIFKAPKSYTRSNKINLSQTDFVKIKKGVPQKSFNREKIPRYVSPVKTEHQDKDKKKSIGVMNEKPKDYYEEYIKNKLKRTKHIEDKNNKSGVERTEEKLKKFVRSTDLEPDEVTQTSLVDATGNNQLGIYKRNNKRGKMKSCDRQKEWTENEKSDYVNIQEKAGMSKNSENTRIPRFHKYQQLGDDHGNPIDQPKRLNSEEIPPENNFDFSKEQIKKKFKNSSLKGNVVASNFEDKILMRNIRKENILNGTIEETKIPLRNKSDSAKRTKPADRKRQYGKSLKDTKSESSITSEQAAILKQNNKSCLSEQRSKLPRYTRSSNESSRSTSCLDNFKLDQDVDATNKRISRLDATNIIKHNKGFRTTMTTGKSPPTRNIAKDDLLNVEKTNKTSNNFVTKIKNDEINYSNEEIFASETSNDGTKEKSIQNSAFMAPPDSFRKRRESSNKIHKCMNDLREIEVEMNTLESYNDYAASQKAKHSRNIEFKKNKEKQNEEISQNFEDLEKNSIKDIRYKIKQLTKSADEPTINNEEKNSVSSKIPQLMKIASQTKAWGVQDPDNCKIFPNDCGVKGDIKSESSLLKKLENLNGVMHKAIKTCDSKIINASQQILKALEVIEKASDDMETNKLHKESAVTASVKCDKLNVNTFIDENKSEVPDKYQKGLNCTYNWDNDLKSSKKKKEFDDFASSKVDNVQEIEPKKEKALRVVGNMSKLLRLGKDSANISESSEFSKNEDVSQCKTLQTDDLNDEEINLKKSTNRAIEEPHQNSPNPADNEEKYRLTREANRSKYNEASSEGGVLRKFENLSKFRTSAMNKFNLNTDAQNRIKALQKKREVIFPKIPLSAGLSVGNKQAGKSPERLTNLSYSNIRHTTDKAATLRFDKNDSVIKASSKKTTPNDSENGIKDRQNKNNDSFDDNNPKNKAKPICHIAKSASNNDNTKNGKKDETTPKKSDGEKKSPSSTDGIDIGKYHLKKIIAFVPEDAPTFERLHKHYDQIHCKENKDSPNDPAIKECPKQRIVEKSDEKLDSAKTKMCDVKTMEEKQSAKVKTEAVKSSFIPLRRSSAEEELRRRDLNESNSNKSKTVDEAKSSEKYEKNVKFAPPADIDNVKDINEDTANTNKNLLSASSNEEFPAKKQDDKPVILTSLKSKGSIPQKQTSSEVNFKKSSIDPEKITSNKISDDKTEAHEIQNRITESGDDLPITNNERTIYHSKIAVRKERVKLDEKVSRSNLGTGEREKLTCDDTNLVKLKKTDSLKKEFEKQNRENIPDEDVPTKSSPKQLTKSEEDKSTSQSSKIVKDTDRINTSKILPPVTNLPFKYAKFSFTLPKNIIKAVDTDSSNKNNIRENKERQKYDIKDVPETSTASVESDRSIPLKIAQATSTLLKESLSDKLDDTERNELNAKIKEICSAVLGYKYKNEKILSKKSSSIIPQSDSHATKIPKSIPKSSEIEETTKSPQSNNHKPSINSTENKIIDSYNSKNENKERKILAEKKSSIISQSESHATRIPKSVPKTEEIVEIKKLSHSDGKLSIGNKNVYSYNTTKIKYNQPITESVAEQLKTTSGNQTEHKSAEVNEKIIQDLKGATPQKNINSSKNRNENKPEPSIDKNVDKIEEDVTETKLDRLTAKLRHQTAMRYNTEKIVHEPKKHNDINNSAKMESTITVSQNNQEKSQIEKKKGDEIKIEKVENDTSEIKIVSEPATLFRKAKFSFKPLKKSNEKDEQKDVAKQNTQENKVDESVEEKQDPFPKHLSPLLRYFMHKRLVKTDLKQTKLKPKKDININHETSATQKVLLITNKQSTDMKPDKAACDVYARYPFLKKYKTRKKIPQCAWEWKMKFVSQAKHKKSKPRNVYTEECQSVDPKTSSTKIKRSGNCDSNCSKSHKILTKIPTSKYSLFTGLPIHSCISKSHLTNIRTESN